MLVPIRTPIKHYTLSNNITYFLNFFKLFKLTTFLMSTYNLHTYIKVLTTNSSTKKKSEKIALY